MSIIPNQSPHLFLYSQEVYIAVIENQLNFNVKFNSFAMIPTAVIQKFLKSLYFNVCQFGKNQICCNFNFKCIEFWHCPPYGADIVRYFYILDPNFIN